MRKFVWSIAFFAMGAFLASCDLQPKISSIPDSIGDFISSRYPALLADPKTEPEIYNSAISDYGVYASPELYGSNDNADYVNYAGLDDYALPVVKQEDIASDDDDIVSETDTTEEDDTDEEENETEDNAEDTDEDSVEETDIISVSEHEPDEIYVPARAAAGTVIVRRGDTLYAIARQHNMTLDEIAKENNIVAPYKIRIGQVLKVKTKAQMQTKETVKPESIKTEAAKPKVVEKTEPKKEVIKVPEKEPKSIQVKQTESAPKVAEKPKADVRIPVKNITVARGETLYSISRRYSVPVNDLAVMNGLSAPFNLSTGQTLRVPDLPVRNAPAEPAKKIVQVEKEMKAEPKPAVKKEPEKQKKKVETKKTEAKEPQKKSETKTKETKKAATQKSATKKVEPKKTDVKKTEKTEIKKKPAQTKKETTKQVSEPPKIMARSSSKFSWPVRGTVLSHYGAKTSGMYNDGINIGAALNTPVVAAENGVVAYAGNEVRGMGNLIIIQHADGWMTVYAHMNSMTVRRGARVSVGQKIGTVGKTGRIGSPQLHFEIRKGTKSYNPVNYLKK